MGYARMNRCNMGRTYCENKLPEGRHSTRKNGPKTKVAGVGRGGWRGHTRGAGRED